ncbi:uncharacterized protein si:dkey-238i5.2 isoform X2 [Triplophysa rosa]|uniref:PH domain-containing protein n=1 Tax=Triplophysa rosa TaxID=992332 RepID=A0A9W7TB59_TRIRA|nr:uncharacterized protein si:dkey-238i5.2 isoform X2 [Triplophysa rosa]KAI7795265.1 hypothetical protein IRJ41_013167 [Triplophysa rosa]
MIKAREAMKRIQPFTIGTKLSVPTETRCPDYVGIILPVPAEDCYEQRNESNDETSTCCQESRTPHKSAPMDDVSEEDIKEDDRDSASPPASSRSIRKIAMCGNTESQGNDHVSYCYEANNAVSSNEMLFAVEEGLSDRSASQLETDPWTRGRKIRNLDCDYSMPAFPHDQPEDASHSQRRDLKDFENSLIQLTTSLDLSQEEPKMSHQKKTEDGDLGLEMLRRRPTPGDHVDRSWVKLRSLLRDYHQDLMLALEVSSFYQQADNIISAIDCKKNSLVMTDVHKSSQDKETREMACQINMLNESASRLSNIHPTLARRVTLKQAEVKENWAFLQEVLRNQKTDVCTKRPSSSPDPLTTCPDSQSFARNEGHSVMGKDVKEEQNRLRGFECSQGMWAQRMWSPTEECSEGSLSKSSCSKLDSITEKQDMDRKSSCFPSCVSQMPETTPNPSNKHLVPCNMSNELTASSAMAHLCLKDNTIVSDGEDHDCFKQSQDHKLEELLGQVEVLWDALQKKYGENDEIKPDEKEPTGNKPDPMTPDFQLSNYLPETVDEGNSGMLAKFLELLDPSGYNKMSQDVPKTHNSPEMAEATEMSTDLLGRQTDGETSLKFDQTSEELQISLSTLTLRINQHLSRCAELSMDLLDIETDKAVLCDPDLSGLDGLQEQQDDLEAHFHIIEGEVKEMERLASQIQALPSEQRDPLREEVQAILQAWEEVGRNMVENRGRLEKFHQIQDYFESYLAMITCTENIRSYILAGSSAWRESEVTEIDCSIETKLDEFSKLATAGQMLVQEESQFKNIIKERTDELQSMLGWIQVNWRAQREQLEGEQNVKREETNDAVHQEAFPLQNLSSENLCLKNTEVAGGSIITQPSQNSFEHHRKHDVSSVVSQESCLAKTSLGSSICLILSFDEQSSGINQVTKQWSPNNTDISLPTQSKEHTGESTSDVQVNSGLDSNSIPMQQSLEMRQVRWPNGSIISTEPEQKSPCGNLDQKLNNQLQSPNKEASSDVFPANIQRSLCNHVEASLPLSDSNKTHSKLSSDMQKPEPSVTQEAQNQESQSSYRNLEENQHSTSNKIDHLRNEVSAEVTHRVFTYLHVSDVKSAVSPSPHTTSPVSPASTSSAHSSSVLVHHVTCEEKKVCNHNTFKASCAFTSKEPIRSEAEQRRRSTLGIVGLERSGKTSIFRQRCNTWPEGERKGKESQSDGKLQVFVKKNMADFVIKDKANNRTFLRDTAAPNAIKIQSSGPAKNICSYLSLGSTISFCLPNRFQSNASELENKVEPDVIYNNTCDLKNKSLPLAQSPTEMSASHQAMETDPEHTKVLPSSSCKVKYSEDLEEPTTEVETQELDQMYDGTEPVLMQEEVQTTIECSQSTYKDIDKHKCNDSSSQRQACSSPSAIQCSPSSSSSSCGHKCLSVHTKIKDLNGHLYFSSKYIKINSPANGPQVWSNGLWDTGSARSARIINCGVRDCAVCFSDIHKESEDVGEPYAGISDGIEGLLQPGHWLFQQEEEELEDIWRGKMGNLTSNCTLERNVDEEKGLSITTNRGQVTLPLHA